VVPAPSARCLPFDVYNLPFSVGICRPSPSPAPSTGCILP